MQSVAVEKTLPIMPSSILMDWLADDARLQHHIQRGLPRVNSVCCLE